MNDISESSNSSGIKKSSGKKANTLSVQKEEGMEYLSESKEEGSHTRQITECYTGPGLKNISSEENYKKKK